MIVGDRVLAWCEGVDDWPVTGTIAYAYERPFEDRYAIELDESGEVRTYHSTYLVREP